jgi:CubicO group peptidase (beta-lactamase class C family)
MNISQSLPVKLIFLLTALTSLCGDSVAQGRASDHTVVSRADKYLDALVRLGHFSGSVLLARDGRVLMSRGYGIANLEDGAPNTTRTRFILASVMKEFTATAIMITRGTFTDGSNAA